MFNHSFIDTTVKHMSKQFEVKLLFQMSTQIYKIPLELRELDKKMNISALLCIEMSGNVYAF